MAADKTRNTRKSSKSGAFAPVERFDNGVRGHCGVSSDWANLPTVGPGFMATVANAIITQPCIDSLTTEALSIESGLNKTAQACITNAW